MGQGSTAASRRQLILEWQQPIYGYVHRMLGDRAMVGDVTQEIFTTALQHGDRVDPVRFQFRCPAQ